MKLQTSKQHLHNVLFCLVDKEIIDMRTFNDLLQLTLIEDNIYKFKKGKNTFETRQLDIQDMWYNYKKVLRQKTSTRL